MGTLQGSKLARHLSSWTNIPSLNSPTYNATNTTTSSSKSKLKLRRDSILSWIMDKALAPFRDADTMADWEDK